MRPYFALAILAGSVVHAAPQEAVAPRTYRSPHHEKLQRVLRQALPSRNQRLSFLQPHILAPLDATQAGKQAPAEGGLRIGLHRKVEPVAMHGARTDGSVWRLAIQSPGAKAMRLHFTRFSVGSGRVWIHDGSGEEENILGPYVGTGPNGDGDFWSETVFSDTVTIEYQGQLSPSAGDPVPFAIEEISHQYAAVAGPPKTGDRAAAASCQLDVTCYPDWGFTAKGVARLAYEKNGETYFCSGTLLNTRSTSFVPYMLTANHCIDSDSVARTLEATWFFQKDNCNGILPNRNFLRSLGANLMVTGDASKGDYTLLRLRSVPDGVTFQGWDPTEKPAGTPVTVIHHPTGDYKRISFGSVVADSSVPPSFYRVEYSAGITEGGSSGAGLFSAPGVLVGSLRSGLAADTQEGYCRISPYAGRHGKFSAYYPALSDFLEDRNTSASSTPSTGGGEPLRSGVSEPFTLRAVSGPTLIPAFTVTVPQGATRLDIALRTTTGNVDVDLFVRFGHQVAIVSGNAVADFTSDSPTGNEQVTISASGTPALRAGTYYIALALLTPNVPVSGTVTATVTAGAGTTATTSTSVLSSGAARTFTLPAVTGPTLFTRDSGFKIDVPQGATRLEVKLSSRTPNADLDLYVRYGQDPAIGGDGILTDFASESPAGEESIIITPSSRPALQAGTYYIGVGLFTPGVSIDAELTATVSTGGSQPSTPSAPAVLTLGQPTRFSLPAVTSPSLFNGNQSYKVQVPAGSVYMRIQVNSDNPAVDVDVYTRYDADVTIDSNGRVIADHSAEGPTGNERLGVSIATSPRLRAGTYYISLAAFSNAPATGTIVVTATDDILAVPNTAGRELISRKAEGYSLPAVSSPVLFAGSSAYRISVASQHTSLRVSAKGNEQGANPVLYIRRGEQPVVENGRVVADYSSQSGEDLVVEGANLRPGVYYIVLGLDATGIEAAGTITATLAPEEGASIKGKLLARDNGVPLDPKPAAEIRYALPNTKSAPEPQVLVKTSSEIKKHHRMREVSR